MSILVKIRVNSENLNFIRKPILASGDQNVVNCKFCFGEEWDGYTKVATFTRNNEAPIRQAIVNDECVIPYSVLSCKCKLYIGVIGDKDDKRITTRLLEYDIAQGAGGAVVPPSPDVLAEAIKAYCDRQDYATKLFVEDAVTTGIVQIDEPGDELDIILRGGDANPDTHEDDDEILNYIFNGGDANGNQSY